MTESASDTTPSARWIAALPGALSQEETERSADAEFLHSLFADLTAFHLRPDDWNAPYGPFYATAQRRTKVPDDLSPDELSVLSAVAAEIPTRVLRIRVKDVLAFRSTGRERAELYAAVVGELADAVMGEPLKPDLLHHCDRGILTALRFKGPTGEQGKRLEAAMVERIDRPQEEFEPIWLSDLLLKHGCGREHADQIARSMRQHAELNEYPGSSRSFREAAARWHHVRGADEDAWVDIAWVVESLRSDAVVLLATGQPDSAMFAASELERALGLARTVPKERRSAVGLERATEQIAHEITAAHARGMGLLRSRSRSVDLTEIARAARATVEPLALGEAVYQFLHLAEIADFNAMKAAAEEGSKTNPLTSLMAVTHLSSDGRVVGRSRGGTDDEVHGVTSHTWRRMIESYELRIGLITNGLVLPGWIALTNNHHLTLGHFLDLTSRSPLVPRGRARMVAQALLYGYDGDFLTAAQLLAPQIENIVRTQLTNAGVQTRVFEGGVQTEIGLSALMEREAATRVFGEDVAFELRALFCDPIGPNLRNEYAHGLVSDDNRGSDSAVYAWWLTWKLIDWDFSNAMHDVAAAEAREPARIREHDLATDDDARSS
ncbi:DUF4209 domain-containing protein [Microbacterium gorillae]|uniref:DUF4209 domain-containing protein n=1 Tax=Microbacterium gorillae TaxID=1231063 RepID=UPI003D95BF9E